MALPLKMRNFFMHKRVKKEITQQKEAVKNKRPSYVARVSNAAMKNAYIKSCVEVTRKNISLKDAAFIGFWIAFPCPGTGPAATIFVACKNATKAAFRSFHRKKPQPSSPNNG